MTGFTRSASIPPIALVPGMILRLEAVDPTTGDPVADVVATRWAIYGDDVGDEVGDVESGPFMLVPGPTPVGNAGDGAKIKGGL